MGLFTYTYTGANLTTVTNFTSALVAQDGWSWADPAQPTGGFTGDVFGTTASSYVWVVQFSHPTSPFVLVFAASSSGSPSVRFAESYDSATKLFTNPGRSGTPAAVYSDNTYYDAPVAFSFLTAQTVSTQVFSGTAVTNDNGLYMFAQTGHVDLYALVFDSAVNPVSDDPMPIGVFRSDGNNGIFTRVPKFNTLSTPASWTSSNGLKPWFNGSLTYGPDPFNVANPTGYNFSPVAIRSTAALVGGQLRGSTSDLLYSKGGASGEEVSIPGVGVYRKSTINMWIKTGDA